jgi:hypothetical protein
MLKCIHQLTDQFETQPQFFIKDDKEQKRRTFGMLGKRLSLIEFSEMAVDLEPRCEYVDGPNVAALTEPVQFNWKAGALKLTEGTPMLTPDEIAEVGKGKQPLAKFLEDVSGLIPKMSLFVIPGTLKGLKVPGAEEPWALIEISGGKMSMRAAPSYDTLGKAMSVPTSECPKVEGDHAFPVPLALLRTPLECYENVAYGFYLDNTAGKYYLIVRAPGYLSVYSCPPFEVEISASAEKEEETEEVPDAEETQPEEEVSEESEQSPEETPEEAEAKSNPAETDSAEAADESGESEAEETDGGGTEEGGSEEEEEEEKPEDTDPLEVYDVLIPNILKEQERVNREAKRDIGALLRNATKQVRNAVKKGADSAQIDKVRAERNEAREEVVALKKKLHAIKSELIPLKGVLNINWDVID